MKIKSCELDILPTYFIKENVDNFTGILERIVNKSLTEGVFADSWKTAILRSLLKTSNLEHIDSNYRPLSNLSFISKLVEFATIQQLIDMNNFNKTTPEHQSAYKENHSCETLLLKFVNDLFWCLERKQLAILVCLDLSAAFDTVDHEVLLKTLNNCFRISDTALNWFKSYLSDRQMQECINNSYSKPKKIDYSVPQGSVGGPVLFNCYCSTLKEIIPGNIDLTGFADDHTLLSVFTPSRDNKLNSINNIQETLIQGWTRRG